MIYANQSERKYRHMQTQWKTRRFSDVFIVDASGSLTSGEGLTAVREEISKLVNSGATRIILNMRAVTQLDNASVGELAASYSTVLFLGGQIKLLHVDSKALGMLLIAKLHMVFDIFGDEAEAVASFRRPRHTDLQMASRAEVFIG